MGADVQLVGNNEPAIAVNPWNSSNLATADANFGASRIRVSTDDGVTWSAVPAQVPPATHIDCGDPSLAFDSQGRLFWTYLGCLVTDNTKIDIFIAQVNPSTGAIIGSAVNVTASPGVNLPAAGGICHDKEWLAADRFAGSPFQDRLYIVWTQLGANCSLPAVVKTAYSTNHGQAWSAPVTLSVAGEGFVWPSHNAVSCNGDVYVAYHSQTGFAGNSPDGVSGKVFVLRSATGGVGATQGVAYPQKNLAYAPGLADITFNVQGLPRQLNGNGAAAKSVSWTQGSAQPWVVPDPIECNKVAVVAADDPTNTPADGGANDDMAVFIVRSVNRGATWTAPAQVDSGPGNSLQFFPTAGVDDSSGCLTVAWYDTRAGATNGSGHSLLDVFLRSSIDGGATFGPEVQINDVPFNPDLGAPDRYPPTGTLRIGEYIGVAVAQRRAHAVWTGNTGTGQQIVYDNAAACTTPPAAQRPLPPQTYFFGLQSFNLPPGIVAQICVIWTQGGQRIAVNCLLVTDNQVATLVVAPPPGADGVQVVVRSMDTGSRQVTPIAVNNRPITNNFFFPVFVVPPGPPGGRLQVSLGAVKAPLTLTLTTATVPLTISDGGAGDCDFRVDLRIVFSSTGAGCSFTPPAGYDGATGLVDVVPLGFSSGFFVRLTNLVVHAGNVPAPATTRGTWKFTPSFRGQGPIQPPSAFGFANLIGTFGTKTGSFGPGNSKGGCAGTTINPNSTVTLQGRANGIPIDGLRTITPAVGSSSVTVKLSPGGPAWTVDGDIIVDLFLTTDCVFLPGSADIGIVGCDSELHGDACNPAVVKLPQLQNLFLTRQSQGKIPPDLCLNGTDVAELTQTLDTKVTGFDKSGDPRSLGGFSFDVKYDKTKVCVEIVPGAETQNQGMQCIVQDSRTAPTLQGVATIVCVTKGKDVSPPLDDPENRELAKILVRPQPEAYSLMKPNNGNGQAAQLLNMQCKLTDRQGDPIEQTQTTCTDADVTMRYLEGDVEPDCVIDGLDTQAVAFRWGAPKGSLLYQDRFNLEPSPPNADNDIDVNDLQFVYGRLNSTCDNPQEEATPINPKK